MLKVVEQILVNVDDMQFGFVPGCCTTDAIFILRQIQEKYIRQNHYFTFFDL